MLAYGDCNLRFDSGWIPNDFSVLVSVAATLDVGVTSVSGLPVKFAKLTTKSFSPHLSLSVRKL